MNPRLQLALKRAAEASDEIARAFTERDHALTEKTGNDFATETDKSVEAHIGRRIAEAFPGDRRPGGEGGEQLLGHAPETGVLWIVDPLDGTFNFVHGFPYVATSVAIEANGETQGGVIAIPLPHEFFSAGKGFGAWRH